MGTPPKEKRHGKDLISSETLNAMVSVLSVAIFKPNLQVAGLQNAGVFEIGSSMCKKSFQTNFCFQIPSSCTNSNA